MSEKQPQNVNDLPMPPPGEAATVTDSFAPTDGLSKKETLKWRLKLMAALVLPVYLETLDYTGTHIITSSMEYMSKVSV